MMKQHTLALGAPDSAFYRSLRRILELFGQVSFRHERSLKDVSELVSFIHKRGIDRVLMPNPYGNEVRLACYRELQRLGIPVIASDRGALPDSWFFDTGFNFDSPSYRPDQWDRELEPGEQQAVRTYIAELVAGDSALEQQPGRVDDTELRRRLGVEGRRILFVPLQRPNDTVVRYFSGAVASVDEFVRFAEDTVSLLNAAVARDGGMPWHLLFKKHPLETQCTVTPGGAVSLVGDDVHIHDLLAAADSVLVLNSGVGLLSLGFGKPTFHVGDAFYGHAGLAERVVSAEQAADSIRSARPPARESVERFYHHLTRRVYSFADSITDMRSEAGGRLRRIQVDMQFRELRVHGVDIALARPRVVVVTPVVPYPITRGSESRVDTMIRGLLANDVQVSLAVLNMSYPDRTDTEIAQQLRRRYPSVAAIRVVQHPRIGHVIRRTMHKTVRAADFAAGSRHRIATLNTCPLNIRRIVREMCAWIRPHYLLVNYAKLTPCVPEKFPGVAVIDTHDYQTQLLEQDRTSNGARRKVWASVFRMSEHRALRRYDRIIAISPSERDQFREISPKSVVHFMPAFTEHEPTPSAEGGSAYDAIFVGSRSSFNVTALEWFLSDVLPLVVRQLPAFSLRVVGPIDRVRRYRGFSHPNVEFLGLVPDIRDAYADSRVVIAPIQGGAGMKIKVVEALGFGRTLVATTKATEGIKVTHLREVWLADDAEGFAAGVVELCQNDELRTEMQANALALHQSGHSLAAAAATLRSIFP